MKKDGLADKVSDQLKRAFDQVTKEPLPKEIQRLLDGLA